MCSVCRLAFRGWTWRLTDAFAERPGSNKFVKTDFMCVYNFDLSNVNISKYYNIDFFFVMNIKLLKFTCAS